MKAVGVHLVWLLLICAVAYSQKEVVLEPQVLPPTQPPVVIHTAQSTPQVELRKHPHSASTSTPETTYPSAMTANHFQEMGVAFPIEPKQKVQISHINNDMTVYDCQGQAVELLPPDAKLRFIGYCPYLAIIGPNSDIQADRVHVLKVYGPSTHVAVNALNFVDVTAPDSKVEYSGELDSTQRIQTKVSGPGSIVQRR